MNCYTIQSGCCTSGIPVQKDGTIHVGESGRGRTLVRVPVPAGGEITGEATLTSVPGEDSAAVVLIRDHSGYRGGWNLREARTEAEWEIACRRKALEDAGVPEGPERDAIGPRPFDRPFTGKVIARGACAQGDAGRMGGGSEYLLVLRDGEAVEIVRMGRLYGSPACVRVQNVGGIVTTTSPRERRSTMAIHSVPKGPELAPGIRDFWAAVTDVPCPCCQYGTVEWAEAGYVPGYRICNRCGQHFLAKGSGESPTLVEVD